MPESSHLANPTANQLHQELVKVTAQRDEAYLWHTLSRDALAAADADAWGTNSYAWGVAKDIVKALGAPATLTGSGPVLA